MTQMYRMSDRADDIKAAIPTTREEAKRWNTPELGFGIFATVNSFNGPRRKENLTRINAWAIDMDEGTKEKMHAKLSAFCLTPSLIVETKRGFQAYWCAADGKANHWDLIVLERLVPYFGSDPNARDLCRILRVPGFLHLKDPSDPFKVRAVWKHVVSYTERQIWQFSDIPWVPSKTRHQEHLVEARRSASTASASGPSDTLWDAIWNLDCEEGLARLSGHWAVSGEKYTFRGTARGNMNVFVDGKSSSCFIDSSKRIGSLDGGGPTLVQWLRWFKHDWKVVIAVLKEMFPQLVEIDEAAKRSRT